jgi:hypothetical protein
LCNFLHFPVTSSPLDPNILLRTLFSDTVSLYSFLTVRDHARTIQLAELWFSMFCPLQFWTAGGRTKDSEPNGSNHSPNLVCY